MRLEHATRVHDAVEVLEVPVECGTRDAAGGSVCACQESDSVGACFFQDDAGPVIIRRLVDTARIGMVQRLDDHWEVLGQWIRGQRGELR